MRFAFLLSLSLILTVAQAYLRPQETATRQIKSLNGIWNFKLRPEFGLNETRIDRSPPKDDYDDGYVLMPVPSSFNDITQDPAIRDHVGWYHYYRDFYLHSGFFNSETSELFIHFDSVHYYCDVIINNVYIGSHSGGHLPFEFQLSSNPELKLNLNGLNRIEVLANNILTMETTIPQAETFYPENTTDSVYPAGYKETDNWFDFFNYAGIHRSVILYTKPKTSIEKVDFNFDRINSTVYMNYSIDTKPLAKEFIQLSLIDRDGQAVWKSKGSTGRGLIEDAHLWYPYTLELTKPYLYTVNVKLLYKGNGSLIDEVNIRTGIRFIEWTHNQVLLNSRHLYLTGFGKHEDLDVKGRGLDVAWLIKDFNLIKWLQANSFRTSHYPYSQELMDLADEYGVMIIDECPAVSLRSFKQSTLNVHKRNLEDLISRDKHHPSVIFWSVANEAESQKPESEAYFREVTDLVRKLDPTRPVTAAINKQFDDCYLTQFLDVIMLNRYVAWYSNAGSLELVKSQLINQFENFHTKYRKPMMISEYGADTVAGLHQSPSRPFSEDYQVDYLRAHFEAFDELYKRKYFMGEHYWNFADFMTKADYTRVSGNRKGLFTRDRQPKASAKAIRCRYAKLGSKYDKRNFVYDHQMYC